MGRVGDTPIIGAGTYADDAFGAASATGDGGGIMKVVLAAPVVARLASGNRPDIVAAECLDGMRDRVSALGGLIVVDRRGALGWARTTETMSWAMVAEGGDAADGV
jgi:beta-aspartyl-peptidase (threonine type)